MEEKSTATLEKIQEAALAEFLDKGFQGASLRQIVKNAGGDHRGLLRLLLQQGGPVQRSGGAPAPPPSWVSSWRPRPPLLSCPRNSSRSIWG